MTTTTAAHRHHPVDESFQTFAGVRSRVLEMAGAGPPLICLHGYSDQADTWRPLMRSLRQFDRHVVAVDLPGFGKAAHRQPGPILPQLDAFVAAVIRDAAARAGREVVVIGNSLGGVESLRAASNSELPISGVVPISPAGFGHSRAIKAAERYSLRHDGRLPLLESGVLPMPIVRGVMTVALRGAACGRPRRADRHAVRAFAAQFRNREDTSRVFGCAAVLLAEIDAAPPPTTDRPVLLLWGDRDPHLRLRRPARRHVDRETE